MVVMRGLSVASAIGSDVSGRGEVGMAVMHGMSLASAIGSDVSGSGEVGMTVMHGLSLASAIGSTISGSGKVGMTVMHGMSMASASGIVLTSKATCHAYSLERLQRIFWSIAGDVCARLVHERNGETELCTRTRSELPLAGDALGR
jgi:hypothetical protein